MLPGTLGIQNLAVDPTNKQRIYISSGSYSLTDNVSGLGTSWGYGLGILFSTDGGNTWSEDTDFVNVVDNGGWVISKINKMMFAPNSQDLFAIYGDKKIYRKASPSSAWVDITPPSLPTDLMFQDIEFSDITNHVVFGTNRYTANGSAVATLMSFDRVTNSWQTMTPLTVSGMSGAGIRDISITNQDSVYVLVSVNGNYNIWKTALTNTNWQLVNGAAISNWMGVNTFMVSPANPDLMYIGTQGNTVFRSIDRGKNFSIVADNIHADVRVIYIHSSGGTALQEVVYAGTDGGIVKKRPGASGFASISGNGLCITQFYGFSNTEGNENLLIGGAIDNGIITHSPYRPNAWEAYTYSGDGFFAKFANNGHLKGLVQTNYPYMYNVDFSANLSNPVTTLASDNNNDCPGCDLFSAKANNWRALAFTQSNTNYLGDLNVYSKHIDASPLTSYALTLLSPKTIYTDTMGKKIAALKFSPTDSNILYIAFRREASKDPTGIANDAGKLYYSDDVFNSSTGIPTWRNITPPAVERHRILDIEIDPKNPERIWVALGNIDNGHITQPSTVGDTVERVFFSDDAGGHWRNVSWGLSALPVNSLVYQEGSDDVLFAGTDVGVFKWNKTSYKWECFNEHIPPSLVMDLEINYCSGKLRAATYGRGIWETSIVAHGENPGQSETITGNVTWSSSRYVAGGVRVKAGAKLTINGSNTVIHMPKNGILVVEPGGQLEVNNAKLTNGCEECMWMGIQAQGTQNHSSQTPPWQSHVVLNGATIEHARNGVTNWNETDGVGALAGGVIFASNTRFVNCRRGVSFFPYYHKTNSRLNRCEFVIDDNYRGNKDHIPFAAHVMLYDTDGIIIGGCRFRNNHTGDFKGKGVGVHATSSSFRIRDNCSIGGCNDWRSRFANLTCGVFIDNKGDHEGLAEVDRTDFDSCSIGIRAISTYSGKFTNNIFNIGNGREIELNLFECHKNIGIYATSSSPAVIEHNLFKGFSHSGQHQWHENFGTIIDNAGNDIPMQVYHNAFENLIRANLVKGKNQGIQFLCNEFSGSKNDIHIINANGPSNADGIAPFQGSPQKAAGNLFTNPISSPDYNINNGVFSRINYYNKNTISTPLNTGNVNVITTSNGTCPSHFPWENTVPLNPYSGPYKADFSAAKIGFNTYESSLADMVDEGSTTALISYINTNAAVDVSSKLLTVSPFVSGAVLKAVADANILTTTMLMDVLTANPEQLRSVELLAHLGNNIPSPLSEGELNELRDASANVSAYGDMKAELEMARSEMLFNANMVLLTMQMDTIPEVADSMIVWYDHMNTPDAEYRKASYLFGNGDHDAAISILLNMPTKFTLGESETLESEKYAALLEVYKSVLLDDRQIYQLNDGEIEALNDIGESSGSDRLIEYIGTIKGGPNEPVNIPCVVEPTPPLKPDATKITSAQLNGNKITAYPNPASDIVIFNYNIVEPATDLKVIITSAMGKIVKEIKIKSNKGETAWDTRQYPPGVYIYQFISGGKAMKVDKVILVK